MEPGLMTVGRDTHVEYFELGDLAEGTIEPRSDQQERLEEFTRRVGSGEFHVVTDITIPCGCIDGRCGCSLKPNSAGGSESFMVADDLTTKQFASRNGTTVGAYDKVLRYLVESKLPIGGHDDEGKNDQKTGCGANDKLAAIYGMIARKGASIRELTESLGIAVSDEAHELIAKNAASRTDFSDGPVLLESLEKLVDASHIDHLHGNHNEVLAVINLRVGTTLDRDALAAEFGENYEAFNVDAWTFDEAASIISSPDSAQEKQQKVAALAYYNLAAALVLGGPKLRVVVLQ